MFRNSAAIIKHIEEQVRLHPLEAKGKDKKLWKSKREKEKERVCISEVRYNRHANTVPYRVASLLTNVRL